MAPVSNCATPSQVQAVAYQVAVLQTAVNALAVKADKIIATQTALAAEIQKLGDQGAAAVNALSAKIDMLLAR